MTPKAGPPAGGGSIGHRPAGDYHRLMGALAARAARLGSRDPEAASQEALRRSLENPKSQRAVEYYFAETAPAGDGPEWPLDQLLAWLHGVLLFVVREEQSRASFRNEIASDSVGDAADASAGPLEDLVERETRAIVDDCFRKLDPEYRDVLTMRIDGMKYSEIARRLGVNENTVATWVSRGIRELGGRIRKRIGGAHG